MEKKKTIKEESIVDLLISDAQKLGRMEARMNIAIKWLTIAEKDLKNKHAPKWIGLKMSVEEALKVLRKGSDECV